jgi:hypothetical protein
MKSVGRVIHQSRVTSERSLIPFQMMENKMLSNETIHPGEIISTLPDEPDAGVYFVGRIRTPWPTRADCPRRGDLDGPECRIEIDARKQAALLGLADHQRLQVLYWMHEARRDLLVQVPRRSGRPAHSRYGRRCGRTRSRPRWSR